MKYYFDFQFTSAGDNLFWFPLFADAENYEQAERMAQAVETALREHHPKVRRSDPKVYIEGLTSDFIDEYNKNRSHGKVKVLNLRVWEFTDIPGIPDFTFGKHLELIESREIKLTSSTIASVIETHKIPVRLLLKNPLTDYEEFVLIDVVKPST